MGGIKKFFQKLFGKTQSTSNEIICKRLGDGYYSMRKVEDGYQQLQGPYTTCAQCKADSGATECREN